MTHKGTQMTKQAVSPPLVSHSRMLPRPFPRLGTCAMGRGKFIGGKTEKRGEKGHSHSAIVAESGAAVCFADPIMFSRGKMTIPEILRRAELRF